MIQSKCASDYLLLLKLIQFLYNLPRVSIYGTLLYIGTSIQPLETRIIIKEITWKPSGSTTFILMHPGKHLMILLKKCTINPLKEAVTSQILQNMHHSQKMLKIFIQRIKELPRLFVDHIFLLFEISCRAKT